MKNFKIVFLLSLIAISLDAQITVTNATFPAAGDNLKLAENSSITETINVGNVAGPQVWDFSMLNRGRKFEESYQDAKSGKDAASFTDATVVLTQNGQEEYYRITDQKMEGLGFGGDNPIFGAPVVVRYSKRPTVRTAPLEFIGSTKSDGEFRIQLPANVFPDSILNGIPATFRPDSVRISFISSSTGLMDAFGTLNMQDKSIEVLREKAQITSQTKIFLKVPIFGWQDIEQLIGIVNISLPDFIKRFLGVQKSTQYNFYSNNHKEILVSASYDSLNVLDELIFADLGGVISSTAEINDLQFSVYPNPTTNVLKLHTPELKAGQYLVTLSDITGRTIYAEIAQLNPTIDKEINTELINKGMYILTIRDQFNNFAISKKIMKQ